MTRKLPSPDKLYDLIMNKGESYSTLALRYSVARSVVANAFRRDCRAAGLPWPLERNRGARISKGLREISVDASLIAEITQQYMLDNNMSQKGMARLTGISQATFSNMLSGKEERIKFSTVQKLLEAINEEVPRSVAEWRPRRGEKAYQNSGIKKRALKNAEDVLDDWEFLRSCGWTSAGKIAGKIGMSTTALQQTLYRHREDPRVGNLKWVFVDDNVIPLV